MAMTAPGSGSLGADGQNLSAGAYLNPEKSLVTQLGSHTPSLVSKKGMDMTLNE